MIVYRCDRCKKEVLVFEYENVTVADEGTGHVNESYGLCESCVKELKNWIEKKETKK